MDELNRFRNAVLAVAAATLAFWLINDWAQTLEILTDPARWPQSLIHPALTNQLIKVSALCART